ncbi:MAG: sulfatase, partial [Bacteroidota bacterium]
KYVIQLFAGIVLVLGTIACSGGATTGLAPAAAPPSPANIVFILVDDLGWMDLGVQGNKWYPTPNIDRLAAEGIRFMDAYAASPVCSPSRAAMMSGISGARTGITDFIPGHWRPYEELYVPTNRTQYLPSSYQTYAESLKEGGYTTAYFGKWHLGWDQQRHSPKAQGFDTAHVQGGWGHFVPPIKFTPKYPKAKKGDYLTDLLTDMTLDFIAEQQDTSFLVVCSHFAVHVPLEAPDEMIDEAGKRAQPTDRTYNPTYVAMVEAVDQGVGRILAALDSLGLSENTLVVFGSDNGGLRQIFNKSDDIIATSNLPLRDEKGTLYEGGIRVPFLLRQPGTIPAGMVSSEPVTGLDLYPTFLAAANLPGIDSLDGAALQPLWETGAEFAERQLFFHYPHYHHSRPAAAIREGDFKLIRFFDQQQPELYNLKVDIGEKNDLAASSPNLSHRLLTDLNNWLTRTEAPMPRENPDFNAARRAEWGPRPK